MIIYSVTITLDEEVENQWLDYMKTKHIPDVMGAGYFSAFSFQKLLEPQPDFGHCTYNIQYHCESVDRYRAYRDTKAVSFQDEHAELFRNRFVAFRTLLTAV